MKWLAKTRSFIHGTIEELGKCTWPNRDELVKATIIVLVAIIILTVFVAAVDFGSQKLVTWLTTGL